MKIIWEENSLLYNVTNLDDIVCIISLYCLICERERFKKRSIYKSIKGSSRNNATEETSKLIRVERNRNVFAVYIIDVSRDCFLRDVAIASLSKISLSVMRP